MINEPPHRAFFELLSNTSPISPTKKKPVVLHDLVLRDSASRIGAVHGITLGSGVHVLDEGDAERTATVLIAGEFGWLWLANVHIVTRAIEHTDSGFSGIRTVKLNHTGPTRPTIWFILDLGAFNFADCREQIHEVLIAC